TWDDRSPLHDTASQGRLGVLKTLLSQDHEVDALTIHQTTPLHEACLGGHGACARALLDAGANVNSRTLEGSTPLFYACAWTVCRVQRSCCSGGPGPGDPCTYPPRSMRPPAEVMLEVLDSFRRFLCVPGHAGCVEVLLTWGADVDQVLPGQGTALYSACLSQELLCVQQLLRDGADVQRGRAWTPPLHATAQIGHAPITRLMLEFDADVQALNSEHQRAVELAPPEAPRDPYLPEPEVSSGRPLQRRPLHLLPLLPLPAPLTRYLLHR
ncbi:unnamed protein product, partial [Boreogadus saida]